MRILVLGAGGIGGYFGGRLVEKGEDVTFLVRSRRKQQIEENGLNIRSVHGDFSCTPKLITIADQVSPFDVVLFSTKAYHLEEAINDLKPYIDENTVIIPLLNGVAHLSPLQQAFGEGQVIGGLCFIETTLNEVGDIIQTSKTNRLVFGEFNQEKTERVNRIADSFSGTKASFVLSDYIDQDIWHKYLFIAALSGVTSLTRAPIGPIRESDGGQDFIQSVLEEIVQIMRAYGSPVADNIVEVHMQTMYSLSYDMKSSMQRDMEKGLQTEGEHLQGYLLKLAIEYNIETPLLKAIYQNLKVYEKMQ